MNTCFTAAVVATFVWLAFGCLTTNLRAAEIELKAHCQPAGAIVLLGDVAHIHGASTNETQSLAQLELVPAPSTGRQRSLKLREVQDLLALQGVKLVSHQFSGSSAVQIGAAEARTVSHTSNTPATKIAKHVATQTNARVQRAIVQHVQDHATTSAAYTAELELTPAQIELVAARIADVTVSGGEEPWTGPQQFTLTVRTRQGVSRIPVTAEINEPERIVAARRALRRGEVIQASDVELQFPLPNTDTTDLPKRLEDVIGRETTHSVATGQPLDNSWLRKPLMVRRGEVVTVFARVGNVQVRTNARAVEDGGRGDVIGVERLDNRQRFSAQVTGVQELTVFVSSVNVANQGSHK